MKIVDRRSNINFQIHTDLSPSDIECLTIEISRLRSKPFLVSTWYRPPQSSPDLFTVFERVIDKIDAENLELYPLGDLNCDLLPDNVNTNSSSSLHLSKSGSALLAQNFCKHID